ncbi:AP-4 complex subunit epsilon-1 isoform X4 [Vombatus ursinus]|uniref:AP-4 complex subunit epsilon-1 isoform X4 n=1 Tax=Vombatus ursinus TaxID=29139 RepID=UPI000FFD740B|nr:AP-4 complex subunit epsilon-1 isoform X4 [Vombatus ursinus]
MAASLHIYLRMIKENPSAYKDLTGSFVTILKQIVGGKLPVDFNYHSVPAPWLQIQLLRILGLLGKDDPRTSELTYDVLDESLRRAELSHNITYAILFECVHTIYTIYPKPELLEKAARCIGKFVLSPKINLKYLGLKALTYVIQQDPNLALQHQMTIIECLDHPDPIIKRETLELLYRITNAQNVSVIVQKMLEYLHQSKEEYIIISLVGKIAELAEKYAPDNEWFIQTMNAVFSVGGDVMHPDIPNNFLRLLAEGFDDENEDKQLRLYAVQSYLSLLEIENAFYPQRFLQVMSWVLGEYSYLLDKGTPEIVITKLYGLLMNKSTTSETKAWIMAAVTKLTLQAPSSKTVEKLIQEFSVSLDTCMRQHAFELKHLRENVELMKNLLPIDKSCEDLVVDASLSFLDGFVAEGLDQGAAPYKPHHQRQEEKLSQGKVTSVWCATMDVYLYFRFTAVLNFEPYGLSFSSTMSSSGCTGRQSPAGISLSSDVSGNSAETGQKEINSLKLEGVKKLWGKEGYLPKKENKAGNNPELQPVAQDSTLVENVDHMMLKKDQPQALHHSEEEAEKQRLASSLFVGLGSESAVSLILEHPGFCFPIIEAESTKSIQHHVHMEKPFTEEGLSGYIKYQVEEDPYIQLDFSVTLSLLDFIRPMKICTEDFGKLWLSFANDVKQNVKVSDSQANLPFALKTLQQKLRLHIVDIIGNEGILACYLLPSVPCLLHLRAHEGMVALWFRSSCSSLPDYLLYQCQKVMEES